MRYGTRPVVGVLLAAVLGTSSWAEDTKAPWWHFGRDQQLPSAPPAVSPAPTMTPTPSVTPIEDESWLSWPSMPKLSWFESDPADTTTVTDQARSGTGTLAATPSKSRARHTHYGKPMHTPRPRNTWAQPAANTAPAVSPWKSMTEGTRTAWHKTVDYVTPGDGSEAPVVASESHSSWWHRMWGEDEQKQGPQTVTEWMAQDRLDP